MVSGGPEYQFAEKPCIDFLKDQLGYNWLSPNKNDFARDGQNQVLLRDVFIESIQRLNCISEDVARATYHDMLRVSDNETWTNYLRGNYSRTVPDAPTKQTIRLINFLSPENNTFTVTNQLYVKAQKSRIPDVVVYVNGIPLVVIEAKSPLSVKDKTGEAFDQIKQYERDIPRLFYSNAFNIITNGVQVLYGTTGASSQYWEIWKDPWPKQNEDFSNDFEKGLWCLLEPSRLLDMLAHFIVFEKREQQVIKKICRYQQFRATNKMVNRVIEDEHRQGLIWHTQGSGKSLTMVFTTLKLKTHLTIEAEELQSPSILVLTDRVDLDDQISKTYEACGLPNPKSMASVNALRKEVHRNTRGLTLLSTIFKFEGSKHPVENSRDWIVLVDECHRTQEKDLGAYLRATLPEARFFGFTGTPVKKDDRNTYENFGAPNEGYLDRYDIDDAVADGATVPVRYTSRKTEWQIEPEKLDVLFDQWFADESDERLDAIKGKGVTVATLAKHPERIKLIAYDLWTHFQEHAQPDGFKAQIVAVDREAVILYKRALDAVITESLQNEGLSTEEAQEKAASMSACVYSSNQEDDKPSEDPYVDDIRKDLRRYALDDREEKDVINNFKHENHPLSFLIVCNKLLTGFDAPIESVMYLDNPLKEHNLLQAIARTNRVAGSNKQYGLIVDYIGVTNKLDEALASYREADVQNAMRDFDVLKAELKQTHREALSFIKHISRKKGGLGKTELKQEYDSLVQALGSEDAWFSFRRKAKIFIRAYEALSPDPFILEYTDDLKWIAGFLSYGTLNFEKRESVDIKTYSAKIRQMLEEHLHITGIHTICKLRHITDPEFWEDFKSDKSKDDLKTAAIRKGTELKKILSEKREQNPIRYGPFSAKVLEILRRLEEGQLSASETLREFEQIAKDLKTEEKAHEQSGLTEQAYEIYKILEAFQPETITGNEQSETSEQRESIGVKSKKLSALQQMAQEITDVYASDQTAPPGWHLKEQLRKELRQQVRQIVFPTGLSDWKKIPNVVEEYALKTFIKIS